MSSLRKQKTGKQSVSQGAVVLPEALSYWIDTSAFDLFPSVDAVREHFVNAAPFPHLVFDGFFHEERVRELLEALLAQNFYDKQSDLFQFKQTADLTTSSDVVLSSFVALLRSSAFVNFFEQITGLSLRVGVVDLAGTLYEDTDFLLCHDDELDSRRIAFLFYLNDLEEDEGGRLQLYASSSGKPTDVVTGILPRFNRLAFFEVSERSFHQVEEVIGDAQRLALGGWLHDRS